MKEMKWSGCDLAEGAPVRSDKQQQEGSFSLANLIVGGTHFMSLP